MSRHTYLLLFLTALAFAQSADEQAEAHARQSYGFAREGRLVEAEREMQEASRLSRENSMYHSALAGLFVKDGKLDGAKQELEAALRLNPPENVRSQFLVRLNQVYLHLGAQLAESRHYRPGMEVAANAVERFPNDPRVLQMLGYFQTKLQLNRDAVRSYLRATQLDPSSPEINVGLGTAQFSSGLEDESVRTLEAGLARFPEDAAHYQALGVVLMHLAEEGQDTEKRARSMFEKSLQIDNNLSEAHYELGAIALAAKDLDSAKGHLLVAERSAPNDSRIHFALARLYRLQGDAAASDMEMKAFLVSKSADSVQRANTIGTSEP